MERIFEKIIIFKLIHIFGNFGKRFRFSLMYLKGRIIFRNHDLAEHFISELLLVLLLYVVMDCCGLLVLDPTLVKARHYFQPKVMFVTY